MMSISRGVFPVESSKSSCCERQARKASVFSPVSAIHRARLLTDEKSQPYSAEQCEVGLKTKENRRTRKRTTHHTTPQTDRTASKVGLVGCSLIRLHIPRLSQPLFPRNNNKKKPNPQLAQSSDDTIRQRCGGRKAGAVWWWSALF